MLTPGREFWHLMFLDNIWPRAAYPMEDWDVQTPRRVEVIKGACFLVRREALDKVGLLDERYHMYTEEVDLCYRLSEEGWQLWYVPAAVVTHFGGASSNQNAIEMYLELYRSKIQFYRKFGGAESRALVQNTVDNCLSAPTGYYVPRIIDIGICWPVCGHCKL